MVQERQLEKHRGQNAGDSTPDLNHASEVQKLVHVDFHYMGLVMQSDMLASSHLACLDEEMYFLEEQAM